MPKINDAVMKMINEINELATGSIDDQIKACKEILCKKMYVDGQLMNGVNASAITELLPTIAKFIDSENEELQKGTAFFIVVTTYRTSKEKEIAKIIIDAGIVPKLVKLLSSLNQNILINTLQAIVNIARHFPAEVSKNGILQPAIQCLLSENKQICKLATLLMANLTFNCEENILPILESGSVEILLRLLDTKNDEKCKFSLWTLCNIASCNAESCEHVLKCDALKCLKKLCDRLFGFSRKTYKRKTAKSKSSENKIIKDFVIKFIKIVTSYGETQIDMVMVENFVPLILRSISDKVSSETKIKSIEVIENIITVKRNLIPTLINEHHIISLLFNNLQRKAVNLTIASLTALNNIISMSADDNLCRQKIREFNNYQEKFEKLCGHSDKEICDLAHSINEFIKGDIKPVLIARVFAVRNDQDLDELICLESDDEEDLPAIVEVSQTHRQRRKRPRSAQTSEGPMTRSKRSRTLLMSADIDNSIISINDGDNNHCDSDNLLIINSSISVNTVSSVETNQNLNNELQSVAIDLDVAMPDEASPSSSISVKRSPSANFNNSSSSPSSLNFSALPIASSAIPNETKYTPIFKFENPLFNDSSHDSTISPDAASTGNETVSSSSSQKLSPIFEQSTSTTFFSVPRNNNHFNTFEYCYPGEEFIKKCCEQNFSIKFDRNIRQNYIKLLEKIDIQNISITSRYNEILPLKDESGFGCISMFFTGTEENAKTIKDKINEKFVNHLIQTGNYNGDKITEVINSAVLLPEHLETICRWLKCRVMVYCNGVWEKYGNCDSGDLPLFVLEKKAIYRIILSLTDEIVLDD